MVGWKLEGGIIGCNFTHVCHVYNERISVERNAQRTFIFLLIWTQKTTRTPRRITESNFMQVLIIPCTIIFTIRVFIMRNVLYYALGLITSKFRSRIHWLRASGKGAAFFSFTRTGIFPNISPGLHTRLLQFARAWAPYSVLYIINIIMYGGGNFFFFFPVPYASKLGRLSTRDGIWQISIYRTVRFSRSGEHHHARSPYTILLLLLLYTRASIIVVDAVLKIIIIII